MECTVLDVCKRWSAVQAVDFAASEVKNAADEIHQDARKQARYHQLLRQSPALFQPSAIMSSHEAMIALGGNIGDVSTCLDQARASLATLPHTELHASSLLYQTKPLGSAHQGDYLNAVVIINTTLKAMELLQCMWKIESEHGRIRTEHWGSRTLDLDLISYDMQIMDTPQLTLPHPQMHKRMFVLQPICDIHPLWTHPSTHKTAETLRNLLLQDGEAMLSDGEKW